MIFVDFNALKNLKTKEEKIKYLAWRFWTTKEEAEKIFNYLRRELV